MSGHIRRRGERSWELKFDGGKDPRTGKRRTRYQSFRGTKRQAEAELHRLIADANAGLLAEPNRITVGEFLDRWLRDWATGNTSPKTVERYAGLINNQVQPHLGRLPIQKLRPVHLAELYATLLRTGRAKESPTGLSARTVGHVHRVLHRALGHATQWGIVQQNVAEDVDPPRVEGTEIEVLTQDQIQAMLRRLGTMSMRPIVILALATGMRRSELLALRWQDVDLDGGKIRVERSLEQTRTYGLRFKSPKTKHGRRTITLPASAIAELRRHRVNQQEHRFRLGEGRASPDALVFPTIEGKPRQPDGLTKEFTAIMSQMRLPTTLHTLRHTHASQLIAGGVDVLTISRRLGHATPAITLNVYGHLFANSDDRAAQVAEVALRGGMSTE